MIAIHARDRHEQPASSAASGDRIVYPCSQAQQRFWFEEQLHPRNPGLNVAVRWGLEGVISDAVLEAAWNVLIARHESLRTRFDAIDGEPIQIVVPVVDFTLRVFDLRSLDAEAAGREAERLAVTEAQAPFDLISAPLIRVSRIVLTDTRSTLLVTAHHTICDGWSVGILAREMGDVCDRLGRGEPAKLPPLPLTYGQFAVAERDWLQSGSFEAEVAAARVALRNYKQFELITDRPRLPVQTSNGAIVSRLLDRAVTTSLAGLARRHGSTLFMTAFAALLALLHRYSGETDIAIGTQVVGRDEVEIEPVVGCFINTVALRGDVSGDPTFSELIERTRDTVTESLDLRHFPLERLIEVVNPKRDLSRNALFSLNFIFQRSFIEDTAYEHFKLIDLPSRSAGSLYDLNFFMVERPDGWRLSCEYNTDLFEDATAEGIVERFALLLRSVAAEPEQHVSRIPLVRDDERDELVVTYNRTAASYPDTSTLPQLFAATVARTPQAIAVVGGDRSLTYAELDAEANRLARELAARGLGPGALVGVLLERSPELVVALLAVLKTGAAYVPLDPIYPPDRLAYIVEQAHVAALVTRTTLAARAGSIQTPLVCLDTDAAAIAERSPLPLDCPAAATDLAYVIYTSGSTGKPKGVAIEHRSLVNFLCAMAQSPGLTATDVLVAVTTISFDIAGLEVFLPLICGARLIVADEPTAMDGAALRELLQRSGATIMQATPVTWQLLVEAGWTGTPRLRMLCGGEALPRPLAEELLARGELWNMYGPTETTIWSSAARVVSGGGPVPLGPPIANTQFYILDAAGELSLPGVPGELYIGGDGVARGYFERPDLTAERFIPDRFRDIPGARLYRTGDLVRRRGPQTIDFLGRADEQIKLRGFRVELGEIESVLLGLPGVVEAAATVHEDERGDRAIWAYVVPGPDVSALGGTWIAQLRAKLNELLPHYMVPAPIIALDALPRTPNGKLDRKALPQSVADGGDAAAEPPATPTEVAIAALIAEMLGRESIGRREDIFALGFHSLLAVRLVGRIGTTLGAKLPLRALFDAPTVERLALRVDAKPSVAIALDAPKPIVVLNSDGERPPFAFLHSDVLADGMYCRRLAAVIGPSQPIYAIAPHGTSGLELLPTVEVMARDYLPHIRSVQPHGPYRLGGFCAGGLVAYELARLLRAQGETVERLVLINASAPSNQSVERAAGIIRAVGLDARLDPRLRESICYNVARFFEALGEGPLRVAQFLIGRTRALFARAERDLRSGMADFEPFEKRRGTRSTENYFAQLVAALTFHPQPYDGELTLIWGMDQTSMPADPTVGWSRLARSVRIAPMAGGHVSPLHDRIEELGRVLDGILQ
jgi:amino acid adenylation domain-containing protein